MHPKELREAARTDHQPSKKAEWEFARKINSSNGHEIIVIPIHFSTQIPSIRIEGIKDLLIFNKIEELTSKIMLYQRLEYNRVLEPAPDNIIVYDDVEGIKSSLFPYLFSDQIY